MKWPWRRTVEVWPEINWGRTQVGVCACCKGPLFTLTACGLHPGGVVELPEITYCLDCDTVGAVIDRWVALCGEIR